MSPGVPDIESTGENPYAGVFKINNIKPYRYDQGNEDEWYYGNLMNTEGSFYIAISFHGWSDEIGSISLLSIYRSPNDSAYGLVDERWYELIQGKK